MSWISLQARNDYAKSAEIVFAISSNRKRLLMEAVNEGLNTFQDLQPIITSNDG